MAKKVVILGGGVAGLSAAHELIERGFDVQVFEKRSIPGGKARSVLVPGSGTDGRKDLPGEHGFRFFPRFYRHLPDTMSRIPFPGNRHGVVDNLVDTTRFEYAQSGAAPVVGVDRFPTDFASWKLIVHDAFGVSYGFWPGEVDFYAQRLWQILTSCQERRLDEYESLGWWDYLDAERRSPAYKKFLAGGPTRALVAAKANLACTRTIGDILVQLMLDVAMPGVSSDRLLNGPTNEVWINPWLAYLRGLGVQYTMGVKFEGLNMDKGLVSSAHLSEGGRHFEVQADYYLCAVPLEVMAKKLTPDMLAADPTLQGIETIKGCVQWMNGIQYYLKTDVPVVHGHVMYTDSAWALTSVSQAQFWQGTDFTQLGDGSVRGILSVDISDWNTAGSAKVNGKTAMQCTHEQIAIETWAQITGELNQPGQPPVLNADDMPAWFIDPDIVPMLDPANPDKERDSEPLLVNYINTWASRPNAHTRIPNLFLASDYVRTNTNLATMEGANEAARRAVNSIIDASGSNAKLCEVWNLHEPDFLMPWRLNDKLRFDAGMPWDGQLDIGRRIARIFS